MDALATVVTLLRPQTVLSKIVHGGGRWGVRYPAYGQPKPEQMRLAQSPSF